MKFILLLIFFLFSSVGYAYSCPEYLKKNEQALQVFNFLKQHKNLNEFKGCQILITTCDENNSSGNQNIIGEVLIKNKSGYVGYIPIMFFEKKFRAYSSRIEEYKNSLTYMLFDEVYEKMYGKFQMWDLRFVYKNNNPKDINKIELGIYSENRRLEQPNGNNSRWYVCRD